MKGAQPLQMYSQRIHAYFPDVIHEVPLKLKIVRDKLALGEHLKQWCNNCKRIISKLSCMDDFRCSVCDNSVYKGYFHSLDLQFFLCHNCGIHTGMWEWNDIGYLGACIVCDDPKFICHCNNTNWRELVSPDNISQLYHIALLLGNINNTDIFELPNLQHLIIKNYKDLSTILYSVTIIPIVLQNIIVEYSIDITETLIILKNAAHELLLLQELNRYNSALTTELKMICLRSDSRDCNLVTKPWINDLLYYPNKNCLFVYNDLKCSILRVDVFEWVCTVTVSKDNRYYNQKIINPPTCVVVRHYYNNLVEEQTSTFGFTASGSVGKYIFNDTHTNMSNIYGYIDKDYSKNIYYRNYQFIYNELVILANYLGGLRGGLCPSNPLNH